MLVLKSEVPTVYQTASVEQVEKDVSDRDAAVKTLKAQVQITATTGGSKEGKLKEYTSFTGYIFVQKPADLRVILQLPLIGSRALDMVSTGRHVYVGACVVAWECLDTGNGQGNDAVEERVGESEAVRVSGLAAGAGRGSE